MVRDPGPRVVRDEFLRFSTKIRRVFGEGLQFSKTALHKVLNMCIRPYGSVYVPSGERHVLLQSIPFFLLQSSCLSPTTESTEKDGTELLHSCPDNRSYNISETFTSMSHIPN